MRERKSSIPSPSSNSLEACKGSSASFGELKERICRVGDSLLRVVGCDVGGTRSAPRERAMGIRRYRERAQ